MWQDAAIGLCFLQNNFDYIMSCVKMESINRSFRRKIMSSRGIFILAITWIVMSPFLVLGRKYCVRYHMAMWRSH